MYWAVIAWPDLTVVTAVVSIVVIIKYNAAFEVKNNNNFEVSIKIQTLAYLFTVIQNDIRH